VGNESDSPYKPISIDFQQRLHLRSTRDEQDAYVHTFAMIIIANWFGKSKQLLFIPSL